MAAQTNAQKIAARQAAVRQWYHVNVIGNSLLAALLDDQDFDGRRGLLRWCQSHVRVAAHLNGRLLGTDANWEEIERQLVYAPTLVGTKIRGGDWPAVVGGLKSRYYTISETVPTRWRLVQSTVITSKLAVSNREIYALLGGFGGEKGGGVTVPAEDDKE